ncbi:Selenocysteine lyase/Cysteine desulfurase [Virgibacillus subterraneus]|uniref:Selenocysteine lyase/Cysteine desulfurase n=1 Tax=Virgibacillus subterraneus TaxID=621109 RepID=A0A1H9AS39_9BACI|nr:aminotransferase class V-fold PLP-dependent enzyme [Virgibacillus subterraneus]SEP79604.1 Selenocysteine lyase/Cysteine desulfurase [Virgibacillus subterraneus]
MVYFDYGSLGIPDKEALKEAEAFLTQLPMNIISEKDYTLEMVTLVEKTREQIADLYNVSADNIAFISNTTEGLGTIASALRDSEIDVEVGVPDIEFMSSALVWDRSDGIHYCQTRDGIISANTINNCLSRDANILCMSAVQEVSGYRFSFQDLLKLRDKKSNEFWIIDGIQEAGVFRRDLKNDQIDAYIVGGHKLLNSPFGLGFMYISDRLLKQICPAYYGYFNLKEPKVGWVNYLESRTRKLVDLTDMSRRNDASIFESGGMINALGALMLSKSIACWQNFGIDVAIEHIMKLQKLFRSRMYLMEGYEILGSDSLNTWSSIITLTNKDGIDKERQLFNKLSENDMKVSLRSINGIGGIRIGFHYRTTETEVEQLVEMING